MANDVTLISPDFGKEIKNLEKEKRDNSEFYRKEIVNIDNYGEVNTKNIISLKKEKSRDKFIKVFIDNLDFLIGSLTAMEKEVFFVLMKEMNYNNIVKIDSSTRKIVETACDISQSTTSKCINSLIKKNVLIKITASTMKDFNISYLSGKEHIVNPQIIGKGSFREISKLRHIVVTNFDFDKFEIEKTIATETASDEFDDITQNLNNHEIKNTNFTNKNKNEKETEVIIKEKEANIDKNKKR